MKKTVIILASVGGSLIMLFIVARATGMLQFYRVRASSMETTIMTDEQIITSNLVKPVRNDIIIFKYIAGEMEGVEPGTVTTRAARLIAIGGDTIEIKNGLAYIDGKLADDTSQLSFSYRIPAADAFKVQSILNLPDAQEDDLDSWITPGRDSAEVRLDNEQYNKVKTLVAIKPVSFEYNESFQLYQNSPLKGWTPSNYGPLIVSKGFYFVLGDNRYHAQDSRYIGFIDEKDYKGTCLRKK